MVADCQSLASLLLQNKKVLEQDDGNEEKDCFLVSGEVKVVYT